MEDTTLLYVIQRLRTELDILEATLGDVETAASVARGSHTVPGALEDQYHRPPSERPSEGRTRLPGAISDPTGDTVSDERRQKLRTAVLVCGPVLAASLVQVVGVRRALERAHDLWKGVARPSDPV